MESILGKYFTKQPLPGLVTAMTDFGYYVLEDRQDFRVKLKTVFMEIGSNSLRPRYADSTAKIVFTVKH